MMAYRQLHSACRTLHRHRPSTSSAVVVSLPCIAVPLSCRTSSSAPPEGHRYGAASVLRHFADSVVVSRRDDEFSDDDDETSENSPGRRRRRRRKTLKCGRARRKWISGRRREDSSLASEVGGGGDGGDGDVEETKNARDDDDVLAGFKNEDGNTLFGVPIGNPIRERYIRSQQKVTYPRTLSGWRTVFRRTWETYLWTFEGFLIKEKKRDADGKIIPEDTDEDGNEQRHGPSEGGEDNKGPRDRAAEAAGAIAENVRKNISTMTRETPKLLKMGQEMTGASTKEELREWVGDQLRLGTACLSEFMRGYRKGRDEEIDRMLHEYFKELDEKKEGSDDAADTSDGAGEFQVDEGGVALRTKGGKRTWGRSERRRLKALENRMKTITAQPDGATPTVNG